MQGNVDLDIQYIYINIIYLILVLYVYGQCICECYDFCIFIYDLCIGRNCEKNEKGKKELKLQYFKEHPEYIEHVLCSFGASVNNFYVLNLIYTYYTPIYNEWNGITNENQEKYSIYNNKSNNKK